MCAAKSIIVTYRVSRRQGPNFRTHYTRGSCRQRVLPGSVYCRQHAAIYATMGYGSKGGV